MVSPPKYLLKCFCECVHTIVTHRIYIRKPVARQCNLVLYRKVCQPHGLVCRTSYPLGPHWVHHWDHGKNWRERGLGKWINCQLYSIGCQRMFVSGWKNPRSLFPVGFLYLWVLGDLIPDPSHKPGDNPSCFQESCGAGLFAVTLRCRFYANSLL